MINIIRILPSKTFLSDLNDSFYCGNLSKICYNNKEVVFDE